MFNSIHWAMYLTECVPQRLKAMALKDQVTDDKL